MIINIQWIPMCRIRTTVLKGDFTAYTQLLECNQWISGPLRHLVSLLVNFICFSLCLPLFRHLHSPHLSHSLTLPSPLYNDPEFSQLLTSFSSPPFLLSPFSSFCSIFSLFPNIFFLSRFLFSSLCLPHLSSPLCASHWFSTVVLHLCSHRFLRSSLYPSVCSSPLPSVVPSFCSLLTLVSRL